MHAKPVRSAVVGRFKPTPGNRIMPQFMQSNGAARGRLWLVLALPFFCGCIHLEQTIRLRRDGSAVISYHYSVAEETMAALANGRRAITARQQGGNRAGSELEWFTNEAAVRKHFSGNGLGVTRYRTYRRSGRLHVEMEVEARDAVRAFNAGCFGALSLRAGPEGTVEFASTLPGTEPPKEPERLRSLCDDLWLRLTVITPGDLVAASGKQRGKRTAVWTFDPGTDREALSRPFVIMARFRTDAPAWLLGPEGKKAAASQP